MATKDDRRAGAALVLLAAAGLVVRTLVGGEMAPGAVAYRGTADSRPERDSVAARAERLARPLRPGETVDVDRAPAEELARLPRIGPALAARIVADRAANGPFGRLEALDRVPGVGPAVLEAVRSHAAFSAPSAPPAAARRRGADLVSLNTATEVELAQLPGIGPVRARAIVEDRRRRGPFRRLDDLTRVSGVGSATLERLRGRVKLP